MWLTRRTRHIAVCVRKNEQIPPSGELTVDHAWRSGGTPRWVDGDGQETLEMEGNPLAGEDRGAVTGVEVEVGLVPVTLGVEGRGQLSEQSLICVPMAGDQSWRAG